MRDRNFGLRLAGLPSWLLYIIKYCLSSAVFDVRRLHLVEHSTEMSLYFQDSYFRSITDGMLQFAVRLHFAYIEPFRNA